MESEVSKQCLEPRISNTWDRRKTFFEVAAAQSSIPSANPNLPEALLTPLVTVLDPCTLNASIHTKVDWNLVEPRLMRNYIMSKMPRGTTNDVEMDFESSSDGGRSRSDTPGSKPNVENNTEGEKDGFIDEIVDLVRNVRKYNDPSLTSAQTWIDKLLIEKLSKQLILVQSYLPGLLQLEEIVNALLFENGPQILENILIEMPENSVTIVNILINNFTPGSRMRYRNIIVAKIVQLYPYFLRRIIEKFAKVRNDCVFACRLAVDYLGDREFLQFLKPMLTDRDSTLSKTVLRSGGRQVLPLVISRLLSMADSVLEYQFPTNPSTSTAPPEMSAAPWCTDLAFCLVELLNSSMEAWKERDIVTITRFVFRTSCVPGESHLAGSVDEPMDLSVRNDSMDSIVAESDNDEPVSKIRRPLTSISKEAVESSPFGDAHEIFVLSALIAVPFFTQYPINQTGAVQPPDRAVDDWLDVARKRVLAGQKVTSSFAASLIYVHSCIMSSRIDELAEFASEGMKRKIEISQRHNHSHVLKNAFTTRCLTEIEVTKRSVCQIITKNADKNGTSLALRTIHALQTAGVYKTFVTDIGSWLEEQLESISLPASDLLADLVDGFAQNSAQSKGKGLGEAFILKSFAGDIFDARTIPKRLFLLLYLCSYREASHRLDSSLRNMNYHISIFDKIPVRYLLSIMENQHENFENVRSRIVTRAAIIFPYILPTPDSMILVAEHQETAELEIVEEEEFGSLRGERMKALIERKDVAGTLETIERSSLRDQLSALPIVLNLFMESLNPSTPQGYEQPLIALFNRYEQLDPRPLFEHSAAVWLRDDDDVTVDDVAKIPSLLFRADRRILCSPPHFHCFVRALNFFNKMVRAENRLKMLMVQQKVLNTSLGHRLNILSDVERKEKELLNGAYLDTQHSVLIHALIEVCDSKRMKDDPNDFAMLEKRQRIRKIACQYIHRTFLDYEGLIRIVLYQKFPLRQIRDLVEEIPALFAGNALILEMLSLADQQRRFFAIVFAAEICRKYRVRESLETARCVCDIVHSLHKFGELPSSNKLWKHVAPALMLLATEFPSLADSINRLLTRVSAMAKNRLAVRSGFLAGDPRHEEYELIGTISAFLDRNSLRL